MSATNKDLTRAQRQRGITLGLLRALAVSAVLIALYYLAPLDHLTGISLLLPLIIGLLALAAMTAYQVWAILRAAHPGSVRSRPSPQPSRCSCCCSRPPTS
jgi:hypothetical protein